MKHLSARIIKMLALILIFTTSNNSEAKKYIAIKNGKWSDISVWLDGSPGSFVSDTDEVIVTSNLVLQHDLTVHGQIQVEKGGSIVGNCSVFVLDKGAITNYGNMISRRIFNRGIIVNHKYLEVTSDIENSGHITNNSIVMAGHNIINQSGKLDGMGGRYFANNTLLSLSDAVYGLAVRICKGE